MYRIVVVDRSAESRGRIVQAIEQILRQGAEEFHFVPRVSLKPLAIEEIKFHGAPDVCIVGEEMVQHDIGEIHKIRKLYSTTTLLVKVPAQWGTLSTIEQLARCGADDVISEDLTSRSFLQKLILLSQKSAKPHQGRLVLVTGGKGGAGITSVAAAIAESAMDAGKKTVLVDFDTETQDLSRFLRARPYINENLQILLDESAVVTEESVRAALVQVWADEPNLLLMPPVPESRALYEQGGHLVRVLLSVFEQLDSLCECIVVDAGCASGTLLEMLYRIADRVLYVVPNDPAALFASVDRIKRFRPLLGETAKLSLLINEVHRNGLNSSLLSEEFCGAAELDASAWLPVRIPFCKDAHRWPGSGSSMAAVGSAQVGEALRAILVAIEIVDAGSSTLKGTGLGLLSPLRQLVKLISGRAQEKVKALPEGSGVPQDLPAPRMRLLLPQAVTKESQASVKSGVSKKLVEVTAIDSPATVNQQAAKPRKLISGVTIS